MGRIQRVLIIRCGALGDLVYATAVIDALQLEYGVDVHIDVVCTPASSSLFVGDKRIHRVFPLKHRKVPIIFSAQKKAIIKASLEQPYDLLVSLESGKQFVGLINRIAAQQKVGMGFMAERVSAVENRAVTVKHYVSEVVSAENIIKAQPKLLSAHDIESLNLPATYLVVAPSNSHNNRKSLNYRAWRFEHWQTLLAALTETLPVVIVGAKGEEAFFDRIKPYPNNVIDLVGKITIPELISVVRHGKAVICTDSATGHIAAAVDTPVFVLMGPNNPVTDSPYACDTNQVYPISLKLSCSPCYKTEVMRQCKDNVCMGGITPHSVLETLHHAKII